MCEFCEENETGNANIIRQLKTHKKDFDLMMEFHQINHDEIEFQFYRGLLDAGLITKRIADYLVLSNCGELHLF